VIVVAEYIGYSMLSPYTRDNDENYANGYHWYHRVEGQGDIATTMARTMATTNAAATSFDSKWIPRRHFHLFRAALYQLSYLASCKISFLTESSGG
jgi:hypothetical protein